MQTNSYWREKKKGRDKRLEICPGCRENNNNGNKDTENLCTVLMVMRFKLLSLRVHRLSIFNIEISAK